MHGDCWEPPLSLYLECLSWRGGIGAGGGDGVGAGGGGGVGAAGGGGGWWWCWWWFMVVGIMVVVGGVNGDRKEERGREVCMCV